MAELHAKEMTSVWSLSYERREIEIDHVRAKRKSRENEYKNN